MASIEERIVAMTFKGEQFLAGVDKSLAKLDQLNNKLKMQEGTKGLENLGAAAQKQTSALSSVADGVSHISDRFKALSVIGLSALNNITNQAIFAGQNLVKSLTVEPILDGFREYETNLNSIQTILANTQASGTKLKDVTAALDELNHYSDQTIYNFSEMAKNIGTFTAAGVGLKPATQAIKGIANLAALSGSNSMQASQAMYQLSQAISSGRVSLEDWNSVVNAGMGGTVFQRALAQNAEKMGTLSKGAVKLKGDMKNVTIEGKSFRESITAKPGEKSWLTSDVLTKTLAQFTGDLTDAQLAAEGFNKAEIKAIQAQAKMAQNAATQVKTLSQLLGTIRESVGSGWAQTWKTIFGDFDEAKSLFTNINNVFGGWVSASADARNKVLADWKALGGRKAVIDSISNAFKFLTDVVRPIREAFRDIFPATTGKQLADWSKAILAFTQGLKVSGETAANIKSTFKGLFAVIDIGWMVVKQLVKTIFTLLGVATEGSGSILEFTGNIGDWLVKVRNAIKNGDGLANVFETIGKVLTVPIRLIKALIGFLADLATKSGALDMLKDLSPLEKVGKLVSMAWGKTLDVLTGVWDKMAAFRTWAKGFFGDLGSDISNMLSGLDFKDILAGINTGLFATLALAIKNFLGGGKGGLLDNVTDAFENLTGALGAMQNTLRAATLLQIAAAVGILTVSMNVLSKIDAAGLTRASVAITAMFTQLVSALLIFEKISGFAGFAKMPFVAAAMILMAAAIDILAVAVVKLSGLDWNGLAKGLTGVTVLLGAVVGAMQLMPNPKGLISTAAGVVILAAGIKVLVSAVMDLSGTSWEDLTKGLIGVGGLLAGLTLFTKFAQADKMGLLQGAGLLLLAAGIKILASAMKDISGLSWMEIARGLVALAGSIGIITAALTVIPPTAPLGAASVLLVALSLGKIGDSLEQLGAMSWAEIGRSLTTMLGVMTIITAALTVIPPTAPLGAASILIVALSLGKIGDALERFSQFSWEEIAKAGVVLAGTLGIIAGALVLMQSSIAGAAALIVVAGALAILAPVMVTLGGLSWEEIGKGLVALAAALAIIGIAGALLTPVIPSLLGLGIAVGLLGAGLALVGAGVFLFATGLTLLAASGVAAAGALVAMLDIILGAVPKIVEIIGRLLVALADLIIQAAPKLGQAFLAIMNTLLDVIVKLTPKVVDVIAKLLVKLMQTMAKFAPQMQDAAADFVTKMLNGLARNAPKMAGAATNVITQFINAIGANGPRIVDSALKMVIKFVNGTASAIRANSAALRAAGVNLALAIIDGMTGGLASGVGRIVSKAKEVAQSALNAAKNVLGIHSPSKEFEKIGKYVIDGFRKGLDGNKSDIDSAFNSLKSQLSAAMKDSAKDVDTLQAKLKKLTNARHEDKAAIKEVRAELAQATKEHKAEAAAYSYLTKQLNDEHSALGRLATQYDTVTAKLNTANDSLANAIKTRDDFRTSITAQFGDMASPTGDISLADYTANLAKQVEDTKSLANKLQQLRAIGLNDEMYKDILATGTSALPFVDELLAGGKASIAQLNDLSNQLDSTAVSLGKTSSSQLYQAAVDSAQGLVDGLKKQQAAIEAQMDKIADAMVASIKKKLGIKSPSRVFKEVGGYASQGLANGLESNAGMVSDKAADMGNQAIISLRKSLSGMKDVLGREIIDPMPTITPVIDLSQIKKGADGIGKLLPTATLTVETAYLRAQDVSSSVGGTRSTDDETGGLGGSKTINYNQYNYSPKALSKAEIYRQTKNQLSKTKEERTT